MHMHALCHVISFFYPCLLSLLHYILNFTLQENIKHKYEQLHILQSSIHTIRVFCIQCLLIILNKQMFIPTLLKQQQQWETIYLQTLKEILPKSTFQSWNIRLCSGKANNHPLLPGLQCCFQWQLQYIPFSQISLMVACDFVLSWHCKW